MTFCSTNDSMAWLVVVYCMHVAAPKAWKHRAAYVSLKCLEYWQKQTGLWQMSSRVVLLRKNSLCLFARAKLDAAAWCTQRCRCPGSRTCKTHRSVPWHQLHACLCVGGLRKAAAAAAAASGMQMEIDPPGLFWKDVKCMCTGSSVQLLCCSNYDTLLCWFSYAMKQHIYIIYITIIYIFMWNNLHTCHMYISSYIYIIILYICFQPTLFRLGSE